MARRVVPLSQLSPATGAGVADEVRVELMLSVSCGSGEHEVLVEVTARGRVRVLFNPCDLLPAAARRLSGSTCVAALAGRLRAFERCLQYTWCKDVVPDRNPALRDADVDAVMALGPALVRAGGLAVPLLARLLGRGPARLTLFVLDALCQIGGPAAADALLGVLHQEILPELQIAALENLGRIADQRAVEPLLQVFETSGHAVRVAAGDALASLANRLGPCELPRCFSKRVRDAIDS